MRVVWRSADTYKTKPDLRQKLTRLVAHSKVAKVHAAKGAQLAIIK